MSGSPSMRTRYVAFVVRRRPVRCHVSGHPDHVLDHDRLALVHDSACDHAHRTNGAGGDRAERNIEVALRQRSVELSGDVVNIDTKTSSDELDRRLPHQGNDPGSTDERLETKGPPEAHSVLHHRGDRIVIVERYLHHADTADGARQGREHERELVRCKSREDA